MTLRLAIATPHRRYDRLVEGLTARGDFDVLRVTSRDQLAELDAFAPDYLFFPHWSWLIPADIYDRYEAVIFHMTDVPYGRGGSPLQNLIRRGHSSTKLTALRCGAELDAGPVYLKRDLSLLGTAEEIFLRAADLMEEMVVEIASRRLKPVAQGGEVTPFKRLRPEDGNLAQFDSLERWFDTVRMLDAEGYPHAFVDVGGFRLEFTRASLKLGELVADVRIRPHAAS